MDSTQEHSPQQEEMPFAIVQGTAVMVLPKDLYIPPDALEVFLAETFEGPLDLLLYLIRRQNLDILDLPIAEITRQYMEYVEVMMDLQLELAAEYLVMAAMLAEIKSRMLLPQPKRFDEEEGDPRAELVRRLQEYERYKQAAEDINTLPRVGRDVFPTDVARPDLKVVRLPPRVELDDMLTAFREVLQRAAMYEHHHIQTEPLSVRERMSIVLSTIKRDQFTDFSDLFNIEEGRSGVVVTLLALLELLKQSLIELIQTDAYGPIHVKVADTAEHGTAE
ncbi:MAG: segregation/condensation protein A [Proteobacteria bacterium]|jgi:segregation and condensation protein A|nr:segregation/condensation protein A [Pseudomonadota bacterium]MCG6935496.1 segregation/condensation protein A [Pseudomonadota bacterium]